MSIGKQVSEAIDKMKAGDPDGALYALCSAIDATATNEYGKEGKASFKTFVHSNFPLITQVAFGQKVLNLNLEFSHPKMPKSADGTYSIQDIFYHAVRCQLYHTTDLPSNVRFTNEWQIRCDYGAIILPDGFVYGLIIAVVAAPVNHAESEPKNKFSAFEIDGASIPIFKLWGRRPELSWLLEAINEGHGVKKAKQAEIERNPAAHAYVI
jgi:hypothetical protein